jgi:hypothetical protein
MLRKEILMVMKELYTTYFTSKQKGEKLLKRNTGSDKGKLITDIGTIVTDFLVKFWKYIRLQFHC